MAVAINLGNQILNHFLCGVAINTPDKIWVSLHTGNPEISSTEVKTSQWPSYARLDINAGADGLEGAFKSPFYKEIKNAKQLLWLPFNGTGSITIHGICLWTESLGGQQLVFGNLGTQKTLQPSDEIVIHVDGLTIKVF